MWVFRGGPVPKVPELLHLLPADNFPPTADVVWSPVLVLQVIGMFPHIQYKNGKEVVG